MDEDDEDDDQEKYDEGLMERYEVLDSVLELEDKNVIKATKAGKEASLRIINSNIPSKIKTSITYLVKNSLIKGERISSFYTDMIRRGYQEKILDPENDSVDRRDYIEDEDPLEPSSIFHFADSCEVQDEAIATLNERWGNNGEWIYFDKANTPKKEKSNYKKILNHLSIVFNETNYNY